MKDKQKSLLRHLFEPGLDPKLFPSEALFYWTARPRNPVLACNDDLAKMFIKAMVTGEAVQFVYCGGSKPRRTRALKFPSSSNTIQRVAFTSQDIVQNAPLIGFLRWI
jgi:hypothetical protein